MTELKLSRDVVSSCSSANSGEFSADETASYKINVSTIAFDPDNDPVTYQYTVSAGKIAGRGNNVVWDLAGVADGVYTITAAADDGCGFCGEPKTKSVTVKNCAANAPSQ